MCGVLKCFYMSGHSFYLVIIYILSCGRKYYMNNGFVVSRLTILVSFWSLEGLQGAVIL